MQGWTYLQDLSGVTPSERPAKIDYGQPLPGEEGPESFDRTDLLAEQSGLLHPYLLSDVEVYGRECL